MNYDCVSCNFMYSNVGEFSKLSKYLSLKIRFEALIRNSFQNKQKAAIIENRDVHIEDLNLKIGEWVQVRSEDEIRDTLDENGKRKGLFFMPEMRKFCGKKFKVYKKIEKIRLESTGEIRKIKSPTVFLEGVFCDGEYSAGCDRSCYCFWREAWLKRASP